MIMSELEFTKFPGGELGFEIKNTRQHEDIFIARLKTPEDIVKLIVCSEPILRVYPKIKLFIPYFPYGRQDRIERPGESFTLRAITNVINSLGYSQIWIADPHSDVTPALFLFLYLRKSDQSDVIKAGEDLKSSYRSLRKGFCF